MRCTECGDVRWSFSGLNALDGLRCELCGSEMVPERRLPHRGHGTLRDERRDMVATPEPAGSDRPAAH